MYDLNILSGWMSKPCPKRSAKSNQMYTTGKQGKQDGDICITQPYLASYLGMSGINLLSVSLSVSTFLNTLGKQSL